MFLSNSVDMVKNLQMWIVCTISLAHKYFSYTLVINDLARADLVPAYFYQTQHMCKLRTGCIGTKTMGSLMKLVKTDTVYFCTALDDDERD
jgi:hypothetical protein